MQLSIATVFFSWKYMFLNLSLHLNDVYKVITVRTLFTNCVYVYFKQVNINFVLVSGQEFSFEYTTVEVF